MRIRAFTLAEVLITLGIIGVISALTIPTLIANTNSQRFRAGFKKSLSTLNQASRMAQARHDVNYGLTSSTCGENASTENLEDTPSFCAILNGTLSGYTYIGTIENYKIDMTPLGYESYEPDDLLAYMLSDGAMVMFNQAAAGCYSSVSGSEIPVRCLGFIDVNGRSKPNKIVSCNNRAYNKIASTCEVSNDKEHVTDVFPVVFYDGTVEPASPAARSILTPQGDSGIETSGPLGAPKKEPNMCDMTFRGINPCSGSFAHGFNVDDLKNELIGQGYNAQQINLNP